MKKFKYILMLMVWITANSLSAEELVNTNIQKMHEKKWAYIVEQAKLTPDEASKVKPVFMNYENAVWELHEKNRETLYNFLKENITQPNYELLNDEYVNLQIKQAQLLKNYHLKLKKALSPEKLFHYYQAERTFKRKLLHNMPQGRKMQKNRP